MRDLCVKKSWAALDTICISFTPLAVVRVNLQIYVCEPHLHQYPVRKCMDDMFILF